ncbi:hypothetical protein BHM03_00052249 [Ensete ventricosum]|nr:hypothetical protein BHM03_00052249 [Ensete ventricosum]
MLINFARITRRVVFRSVFRAPSRKFKILAIPDVWLAHGKSYEHGFMKKCDDYKLCTKSRSEWSFDRFFVHLLENSKYWPSRRISPWEVVGEWFRKKTRRSYTLRQSRAEVEFRSIFRAPSRKFKILAIPDVLAHGKSYEHGFAKKYDGHKLCAKTRAEVEFRSLFRVPSQKFKILAIPDVLVQESSFDRFFVHRPKNLNIGHSRRISPWYSRVLIGFSCTIRKFKILPIPNVIAHGKSYEHVFMKKRNGHKLCTKLRAESSFDRFFMHRLGNSKYWSFQMY